MIYTNAPIETIQKAADVLTQLFPKTETEPVYSLGFQRWMKLSKKKKLAVQILNNYDYNATITYLENLN